MWCRTVRRSDTPILNEQLVSRHKPTSQQQRRNGKRHYVVDYFVIVDYAIFNRCDYVITDLISYQPPQDAQYTLFSLI